jgi:hypothetical protein
MSGVSAECLIARFGNLEAFNFGNLPDAAHDALCGRSREPDMHHRRQLIGREAVRMHDCLLAACRAAAGEQRERAALIRL